MVNAAPLGISPRVIRLISVLLDVLARATLWLRFHDKVASSRDDLLALLGPYRTRSASGRVRMEQRLTGAASVAKVHMFLRHSIGKR